MSAFADSSAVLKLYTPEEGSAVVGELRDIAVSALARVEVASALWRKHRAGELEAILTRALVDQFEFDLLGDESTPPRFAAVDVDHTTFDRAARLVAMHPLGAGDAIQLASALDARGADPSCDTFACFDQRLRSAAVLEGFALIP